MSAVLQLSEIWGEASVVVAAAKKPPKSEGVHARIVPGESHGDLTASLAFYRRHTEKLLRRYLYASTQVGRTPSIFNDPVSRGWASSRIVKTFEDAVIFVLDVERCLERLGALDKMMLCRVVLQEYTHAEAAALLGMSVRTIGTKLPEALDRLTMELLEAGLLVLPY